MFGWLRRKYDRSAEGEGAASPFDISHLQSGIGRQTVNSVAVTLVSSVLIFALQIVQLVVLSRLLSPEDFGLVGMALVATGFVRLFADVGLATATVQRDEIDQAFVSALFYIDLLVAIALMLVCFAIAPLSAALFSEPRVTALIVVVALTFPLTALRGQHQALLSRRMLFMRLGLVNVGANLAGALAAILAAWLGEMGYWSVVIGLFVSTIANLLLAWIVSPWLPSRPGSLAAGRSALRFGLNVLGTNLAGWLWKQADRGLIGWRWDATELGYYTRAYSVLMVPIGLVSGPIGNAVIPALSRLQNEREKWTALMLASARAMAFFAGLLTLGLALNAQFIVRLILGPEWSYSATIFSYLALSLYPSFIWEHARFVFISRGRADTMRRYAVMAAAVHVAAFAIGVGWGAIGVAISLAVASALVTPWLLYTAARVGGLEIGLMTAQFVPSLLSMLLVYGLWLMVPEGVLSGGTFAAAALSSIAILATFTLAHLAFLPFHAGLREDIGRIRGLAMRIPFGRRSGS